MSGSGQRTIHVALIGVTGAGKSTTVNMLTGGEIAQVNNDAKPCTTEAKEYKVVEGDITYCIWDTRGLNEPEGKEQGIFSLARVGQMLGFSKGAERELKRLLHDKNPDLVLLCIDANKISNSDHWGIYRDIYASLPKGMKVAVVVTRLRNLEDPTWKETCSTTAGRVFKEFPGTSMVEGVPKFEKLDDQKVKDCRDRILTLISKSC